MLDFQSQYPGTLVVPFFCSQECEKESGCAAGDINMCERTSTCTSAMIKLLQFNSIPLSAVIVCAHNLMQTHPLEEACSGSLSVQ